MAAARVPAARGPADGIKVPDAAGGLAAPGVTNGWLPQSPCDEGCLPPPGDAPSVGPLRLTVRLAAVGVVVLASLRIAALGPVLRPGVRDRLTRQWFRVLLTALGVRLLASAGARFAPPGTGVLVVA